jgi:hypothetical protein
MNPDPDPIQIQGFDDQNRREHPALKKTKYINNQNLCLTGREYLQYVHTRPEISLGLVRYYIKVLRYRSDLARMMGFLCSSSTSRWGSASTLAAAGGPGSPRLSRRLTPPPP